MCVFDYQFSGLSFSHVSHGGCGRIGSGGGTVCLPTRMHATDQITIASIFIEMIPSSHTVAVSGSVPSVEVSWFAYPQ